MQYLCSDDTETLFISITGIKVGFRILYVERDSTSDIAGFTITYLTIKSTDYLKCALCYHTT